jgi:hypothetical protein
MFEEDSMSIKSHGKGILILFLIALITLLGCPTGSPTDPADINDDPNSPNRPNELGPKPSDPGPSAKPDPVAAEELAGTLGLELGYVTLDKTNAVVTANANLEVLTSVPSLSVSSRAIGDLHQVAAFTIKKGVTFRVPAAVTVTITSGSITVDKGDNTIKSGAITTAGKIDVKSSEGIKASGPVTLTESGNIEVAPSASIKVDDGGKIDVQSAAATVSVPEGAAITVATGGSIEVKGTITAGGTITVAKDAGINVANNGTLAVGTTGKVENSGTLTANGTVDVASGGVVEVKSGGDITIGNSSQINLVDNGGLTVGEGGKITVNKDISDVADKITVDSGATVSGSGASALALILESKTVTYNTGSSNALSVAFTFSENATVKEESITDWDTNVEDKTITATYKGSSKGPVELAFTATSESKELAVSTTAYAVEDAAFTRAAGTYQVLYYGEIAGSGDNKYYVAGVKTSSEDTKYYLVTDTGLKGIFNAIYTPNAPGTSDTIEAGKTTIAYTDAISAAALNLISVTLDSADSTKDKIEVEGTTLPIATGASASKEL